MCECVCGGGRVTHLLLFPVNKTEDVFEASWDDSPQFVGKRIRVIRGSCNGNWLITLLEQLSTYTISTHSVPIMVKVFPDPVWPLQRITCKQVSILEAVRMPSATGTAAAVREAEWKLLSVKAECSLKS